jgi:hypothetical protein
MIGNALIRSNLHINPDDLETEQWARYFCEAVWLENERLKRFATLMTKMWGG